MVSYKVRKKRQAKQELEVNGGSGDAVSSGNEVSENMEEEVGS